MITFTIGAIWGAAIGIVLALWCFVRYLDTLQQDVRARIARLEHATQEWRPFVPSAAEMDTLNRKVFAAMAEMLEADEDDDSVTKH